MGDHNGRNGHTDIDALFAEGTTIDRALQKAVAAALRDHKRAGNPVATWSYVEQRVVWVAPADIPDND